MSDQDPELFAAELRGSVTRILFENRDSGWAVVRFEPDEGGTVTVVGPIAPVFPGESLQVTGEWETDPRYGRQFRARGSVPAEPRGEVGTLRYLASGVLPGVGPELARRLVDRFGADVLRVLDEEPERLLTVRGIGDRRLQDIKEAWVERSAQRQARIFLQGHGLGPALAERILRAWGEETVPRVRREPYELIREVRGVGFRTADALALRTGIERDAPERLAAGLRHRLREAADSGHCYVPRRMLVRDCARLLELEDAEPLDAVLDELAGTGELVVEAEGAAADTADDRVYLGWLHGAELRVARRLSALGHRPLDADPGRIERVVLQVEDSLGLGLAPAQREAVLQALGGRLVVVTGGPGTGKTTLVHVLVRAAAMLNRKPTLAAPTGRAAKRLEQATGRAGSTLHRLLEYRYETGFGRGPDNPLDTDLLVIDEVSMVDLPLMDATLGALPPDASLMLVGDADQLPPVGPGAVLRDTIESGVVPIVRLRDIYRQAAESLIVRNAHRVNAGQLPETAPAGDGGELGTSDFYVVEEQDPERAREIVLRLVTERIPARFGLDPLRDIQVLVPMHRGRCGVARLNAALQDALNPGDAAARPETPVLRPGDRVMQLRNDYDREVFNGDIGRVEAVDGDEVAVEFAGRVIGYDRAALGDLTLAYATSVHKSQGSEYPAVVAVLLPEHRIMLQRNLLYTALTRARELAVLITTRDALRRAVENAAPARRYTTLASRLAAAAAGETAAPDSVTIGP